jgi:hypothetical protein
MPIFKGGANHEFGNLDIRINQLFPKNILGREIILFIKKKNQALRPR